MRLSKSYFFFIFMLTGISLFSQENSFNSKWDKGIQIESKDKQFKLKFGGRIMIDHAFFFTKQ